MLGCFPIGAKTPPGSPPKNSSPRRRVNSLRGNLVTKYTTPIEADYVLFDQMVLGSGSFGLVIMANSRVTNVSYAVKFVQKGSATPRVEREIKLLADIDHINVARLYSVYDSPKKVKKKMIFRFIEIEEPYLCNLICCKIAGRSGHGIMQRGKPTATSSNLYRQRASRTFG